MDLYLGAFLCVSVSLWLILYEYTDGLSVQISGKLR